MYKIIILEVLNRPESSKFILIFCLKLSQILKYFHHLFVSTCTISVGQILPDMNKQVFVLMNTRKED